jgi:drug/metabolite transporter (DMT)-like permease
MAEPRRRWGVFLVAGLIGVVVSVSYFVGPDPRPVLGGLWAALGAVNLALAWHVRRNQP